MLTFSETLDQPGGFTRSAADAAWLAAALAGEPVGEWWAPDGRTVPRLAVVRTAEWPHATEAQRDRFQEDVAALEAAGARVEEPPPGSGLEDFEEEAPAVHRTIMAFEGAQALGDAVARAPERVSETLRRFLAEGAVVPEGRYRAALGRRERWREGFAAWGADFDALLTPPVVGEAPGLETTGDPRFCTRWTLLGAPALVLPTGRGPAGLPLGLQLGGVPGSDRRLLAAGAWVEGALPPIGRPPV
jgi:Asp-tRNA(Asn)/Glu-tRNA(Gln) amidotransferase A subunit family amidase